MMQIRPETGFRGSSPGAQERPRRAAAGFTLIELLVSVALFLTLAALVVPAVVAETKKAEVAAVVMELEGMAAAVEAFYLDVKRHASELNQLVFNPNPVVNSNAAANNDNLTLVDDRGFWMDRSGTQHAFPTGLVKNWEGPYLGRGYFPQAGNAQTNLNGKLRRDFLLVCTGGKRYLAVAIGEINLEDARLISLHAEGVNAVGPVSRSTDGTTYTSANSPADASPETSAGMVRWYDSGGDTSDGIGDLLYLVTEVGAPGCP